jgi:sortase A
MRRWIEILLLVAGLSGVGIWIWSNVRMSLFQKQANRALEHQLASRPAMPGPPAPPALVDGELLGRLVIPRLNLRAVVREGAGEGTLDVALGHIPGTALPGQSGNVGIAGHRDTLFRGLRAIADDDLIQLQTTAGTFNYRVASTDIVKPSDVEVLRATAKPELTLVTCYPFYYVGSAPNRFIVKAHLVEAPTTEAGGSQPAPPAQHAAARTGKPASRKLSFVVSQHHTSRVAPGVLIGLYSVDARRHRASGWIWVAPERRRIWLWSQTVNQPLVFRGPHDGKQRQLVLTSVTKNAAAGYLVQAQ